MGDCYFIVPLGALPALQRLQSEVVARVPSARPEAPRHFHITLCAILDDAGAEPARVTARGIRPFVASGALLHSFPKGEEGYPIVVKLDRAPYLLALQHMIYNQLERQGCQCSPFSIPDRYTPHITLAYADRGIGRTHLRRPITVRCDRFMLTANEYEVIRTYPLYD